MNVSDCDLLNRHANDRVQQSLRENDHDHDRVSARVLQTHRGHDRHRVHGSDCDETQQCQSY